MNETEISAALDRLAPKRPGDTDRGILRASLHAYLKAGKSETEAYRLARGQIGPPTSTRAD